VSNAEYKNSPNFQLMIVRGPGFSMHFTATPERVRRVSAFIFKEAAEAEVEYQESLKATCIRLESAEPRP
jgi:hypothetical protein